MRHSEGKRTITDINCSLHALPSSSNSSSHPTSRLPTSNRLNSMASNSRHTLLLPTASLLARRRRTSSNRLVSQVLEDLTDSLVAPALFLATVVWVDSLRRPATACLLTALLLPAKASLALRQAHSLRTTSRCRLARLVSRDLLTCRALVKDPLEVEASKVHRSQRLLRRRSNRTTRPVKSLSRCLVPRCPHLPLRLPLLRRRLSRSPPLPQLPLLPRRPRSNPSSRRPRRNRQTVASLSHLRPTPQRSLLRPNRQQPRVSPRLRMSRSLHLTLMLRTPLPLL
jgi:hypothetical protein